MIYRDNDPHFGYLRSVKKVGAYIDEGNRQRDESNRKKAIRLAKRLNNDDEQERNVASGLELGSLVNADSLSSTDKQKPSLQPKET